MIGKSRKRGLNMKCIPVVDVPSPNQEAARNQEKTAMTTRNRGNTFTCRQPVLAKETQSVSKYLTRTVSAFIVFMIGSGVVHAKLPELLASSHITANASGSWNDRTPLQAINGNGLFDFDGDGSLDHTHQTPYPGGTMWLSAYGTVADQWIDFTFDATYEISAIKIWNYNESGNPSRGVRDMTIYFYTDGGTTPDSSLAVALTQAPGTSNYDDNSTIKPDILTLGTPVYANYILFDIASAWHGTTPNHVGLSEVQFTHLVPEPGTLALACLALAGACLRRRRR